MNAIQQLKTQFAGKPPSTNTLLQVILAYQLFTLNYTLDIPTIYTIPVDLRRYLSHTKQIYGGNLASQIRVTIDSKPPTAFDYHCRTLQQEVDRQLELFMPLGSLIFDWILLLAGKKTYKSINRKWLLDSMHTDLRFFVLSNLGNLSKEYEKIEDFCDLEFGIKFVAPLMGAPPLAATFAKWGSTGHLTLTYDERVFSEEQIDQLYAIFEPDQLSTLLENKPQHELVP